MIAPTDEGHHRPGAPRAWSEGWYFAWFAEDVSGLARIANRPGEGTQDVLLLLYHPDGSLTVVRDERELEGPDDLRLAVGGVSVTCEAPLERWRIACDAPGHRAEHAGVLIGSPGELTPVTVDLDLEFAAEHPPAEWLMRCPSQGVEARLSPGHFEQHGTVSGTIGDVPFAGRGARDKSWGVRDWAAPEHWRWCALPFGPDLALNAFTMRHRGHEWMAGWSRRDGATYPLIDMDLTTEYQDRLLPERCALTMVTAGHDPVTVTGEVLQVAPMLVGSDGRQALLVEALTRWYLPDGRTTLGLAEYLHQLGELEIESPLGPLMS